MTASDRTGGLPGSGPRGDPPSGPASLSVGYRALRDAVASFLLGRDVLVVSGPDAISYLQGQCSQDVAALASGATADSLLLSPQGKIDALIRITRTAADTVVVDTDAGFGDAVEARLKRFRLRVKADIEPLAWGCLAVRGPDARSAVPVLSAISTRTGSISPTDDDVDDRSHGMQAPALCLPVAWPGLSGFDLLGPIPAVGSGVDAWLLGPVVRCGSDAWDAARIEAGVPVNGRELTAATIAEEAGLVDRTVSFTKGCYTGQELVARLDSRGSNVARRLCGVVIDVGGDQPVSDGQPGSGRQPGSGGTVPPVGATVWTADGGHEVGRLTSVAWSPGLGAPVALTMLHRRVTPPGPVVVRWEGRTKAYERSATTRPLPLVG